MRTSLSNEYSAMLQCLNLGVRPEELRAVLSSPLDWERMMTTSAQLSLAPYLYSRLKTQGVLEVVPQKFRDSWRGGFLWLQAENMKRFVHVQRVLTTFDDEHIPTIVLKGAALASLVYPSLGCRAMADVDLLLLKQDLLRGEQILETLGFQADEKSLAKRSKQWWRDCHHHIIPYMSQDGSVLIELHHHIIEVDNPVCLPIEGLWDRSMLAQINAVPCRVLAPDDMLLHLCCHLSASDYFLGRLRGLCDIAQIIAKYKEELDWERLFENAKAFGIQKHLYYSLWLARECVGAEIPSEIFQKLEGLKKVGMLKDGTFKLLIHRAIFNYDYHKHPLCNRAMQDTCVVWLSQQNRFEKIKALSRRPFRRFREAALYHEGSLGRQSLNHPFPMYIRYLGYLFRKILWISPTRNTEDSPHAKK